MSSTSKAEIILVPGGWHLPAAYAPTTSLLEAAGFVVHGISLASVGANPPLKNFDPDVDLISAKVEEVIARGKDVVILMHSYGGVVGCEGLKNYLKELEGKGQGGGKEGRGEVKRMVFCCAFVLHEGGSLMLGLGGKDLPWFNVKGEEVTPDNPREIFYNDVPTSVSDPIIANLLPHSYSTFSSQLTVAPWKVIPSTYILCTEDNAIPLQAQQGMIAAAQAVAPKSFDVVETCKNSHSPFVSTPNWFAQKIAEAAGGSL